MGAFQQHFHTANLFNTPCIAVLKVEFYKEVIPFSITVWAFGLSIISTCSKSRSKTRLHTLQSHRGSNEEQLTFVLQEQA